MNRKRCTVINVTKEKLAAPVGGTGPALRQVGSGVGGNKGTASINGKALSLGLWGSGAG